MSVIFSRTLTLEKKGDLEEALRTWKTIIDEPKFREEALEHIESLTARVVQAGTPLKKGAAETSLGLTAAAPFRVVQQDSGSGGARVTAATLLTRKMPDGRYAEVA